MSYRKLSSARKDLRIQRERREGMERLMKKEDAEMVNVGNDGVGQHAAPARTGILSSLPGRTIIQGVLVDVLLALALVVYEATSRGEAVNWNLLWGLVLKTVLMTVASSIMKRVKPPVSPPG